MKYKGKITDPKDLVTKEYADGKIAHYGTGKMPTASSDNEGEIVQYVGTTTASAPIYTHGRFYECVENASNPGTYDWEEVAVNEPVVIDNITVGHDKDDKLCIKKGSETDGVDLTHLKHRTALSSASYSRMPVALSDGTWSETKYVIDNTGNSGLTAATLYTMLGNNVAEGEYRVFTNVTFDSTFSPAGDTVNYTLKVLRKTIGGSVTYNLQAISFSNGLLYTSEIVNGTFVRWKQLTWNVYYGATAPSSPKEGDIWINEDTSLSDVYSKTEADDKFIEKDVEDVGWTNLTLSHATAGTVSWCCKNNIVYIEGTGLNWPGGEGINCLATGIPAGYRAAIECKGELYRDYGKTFVSMCWNAGDAGVWFHGASVGASDGSGRLLMSYPIL